MAYAPYAVAKGGFTTVTSARERPGFFRRLFNAMVVSRQLQADREIERYLRCVTANSPTRGSVRSNGVSCQRRRTFEVHDVDLSGSRACDAAARRLRSCHFILQNLRRGFPRRAARGRRRAQALSVHRLVRRDQAAPSTTRMSRSTLPVPSALSASL